MPTINQILWGSLGTYGFFDQVHGGTTQEDIVRKLEEAIEISRRNKELSTGNNETDALNVYTNMGTVLFFDEANTTEAIGIIKEIMCDGTYLGRPLPDTHGLHIIAACNPYRK